MKKTLCLILTAICLSSTLAACKEDIISSKEPLTITMFSQDPNPDNNGFQNPVAVEITKRAGVFLDITYPIGEVSDYVNRIISGKEYPDLIFAKGAELNSFIEAGTLMDLTPLIDMYGPNIKKLYGRYLNRLSYSYENRSIYTLGSTAVQDESLEPNMGFALQHSVVKELKYPKIQTVKDFEAAITKYKELHPFIDGKPTIGLTMLASDWYWNIGLGNGAAFATGAPDDGNWYIDPYTYEAKYRFTRPQEKEYYRWLNHMNDIGLLDPDSFVQKSDVYYAKIANGTVLGLIDAKWVYSIGEDRLKAEGNYERTYGLYPVQYDKTTKAAEFRKAGYNGGWGVGISTSCKDPAVVIKFLDWMCSDEAQILRNWGIEGENYQIESGRRVLPDEELEKRKSKNYKRDTGVEAYTYPFPRWGYGKKDDHGESYYPVNSENITKSYSEIEKEVLTAYGATTWKELYPQEKEFKVPDWGLAFMINIPAESDLSDRLKKFDEVMRKGLPQAILCKPSDFDEAWEAIMKELQHSGVEIANEEFTKLIKAQIELYKQPAQ
jgi:putative aldouronate transport system substrate-binding protein